MTQFHVIRQSYQKGNNNIFDVIWPSRETARPVHSRRTGVFIVD